MKRPNRAGRRPRSLRGESSGISESGKRKGKCVSDDFQSFPVVSRCRQTCTIGFRTNRGGMRKHGVHPRSGNRLAGRAGEFAPPLGSLTVIAGGSAFASQSPASGSGARRRRECSGKVALIREAAFDRDFRERQRRVHQQGFTLLDALIHQPSVRRCPRADPESAGKVGSGKAAFAGDPCQRDFAIEIRTH